MERTCARAVDIGLPAVAFTEHADYTSCADLSRRATTGMSTSWRSSHRTESLTTPTLDLDGYLECLQRCRDLFPGRCAIISGVELGEPHWHTRCRRRAPRGRRVRPGARFLALPTTAATATPSRRSSIGTGAPTDVVRDYLLEIPRLVSDSDAFAVLAHIDYAVRTWPQEAGPFDPRRSRTSSATPCAPCRTPVGPWRSTQQAPDIPRSSAGGARRAVSVVTFGSDAHDPIGLARGFTAAVAMVEAHGFRPGRHPYDVWTR